MNMFFFLVNLKIINIIYYVDVVIIHSLIIPIYLNIIVLMDYV